MFAASGLKGPPCGTPFFLLSAGSDDQLDEMQDFRVLHPACDLAQEYVVSNIIEVLGQIDVDDRCHPAHQAAPDFRQGTMRRPLGAEPVGVRAEVSLEDRFED